MELKESTLKTLIIIAFAWLFSGQVYGQEGKNLDVVYLKDGSIIRGTITAMEENKKVKIETLCENVWVFPAHEIDSVTVEFKAFDPPLDFSPSGYAVHGNVAMLVGDKNTNGPGFSFQIINGYQFENGLYIGGGTGADFYDFAVVPVFADVRYHFFETRLTPFVYAQGGYAIPTEQRNPDDIYTPARRGGYRFNAGTGFRRIINNHAAVVFTIGYQHQSLAEKKTEHWWWNQENIETTTEYIYKRIELRIGFEFH